MPPITPDVDVAEYLPLFLAEAGEHLGELNLAVVRIEADPADTATVNEIFRIAHSLKAMSATMGFAGIAALTHTMEDVFELLRQRSGGLSPDAVGEAWLRTDQPLDVIAGAVKAVPEVDEATLFELGGGGAAPRPRRRVAAPERKRRAPAVRVDGERLAELGRAVDELREREAEIARLAVEAGLPELAGAVEELARSSRAV